VTEADFAREFSAHLPQAEAPVDALPKIEDRLAALLERGLGLAPTPHMLGAFVSQSKQRAHSLGIEESAYLRQLELGGPAARAEWMAVAPALVVGETFLFRDNLLWNLIENTLLPGLAELTRPVWLWSAGCSTGEEAYTLAIVARRALGEGVAQILATDVNPKAVAAARVGVYGQWSLRGVDKDKRDGLIVNGTQTVRIHEDIKSIVRFETQNLNDDSTYPPAGMKSFEMIVCRNVLIYMSHAARVKIIRNLCGTLTPGGVLILGHGEATGIDIDDLVTVERHDAGVIYRKPLQPIVRIELQKPAPARAPAKRATATPKVRTAADKRVAAPATKDRKRQSTAKVETRPAPAPAAKAPAAAAAKPSQAHIKCRELLATAMAHARQGKLEPAERVAAAAITADSLDPEPHVLLAALFMARGALREAEKELRRSLFLDPVFVPALWQIGNLYGITERKRQAAFAFARALTQLEGEPPEKDALPFDNLTVGELSTLLRAELGERVDA
jgi:chemotaxis protein methyltransferase CheR